jgi:hypothetical protein
MEDFIQWHNGREPAPSTLGSTGTRLCSPLRSARELSGGSESDSA